MPSTTQSSRSLPPGAPVYYLGRHANWWITALASSHVDASRRPVQQVPANQR
jgi:hypothetical protein